MKIAYLINDMYGIGGTVRTVANQTAALSARHEVEIVSVFQHRADPLLPVPPQVKLRSLVDVRRVPEGTSAGVGGRPLYEGSPKAGLPPTLFPVEDTRGATHSRLTDERLEEYLATTDADVVVGTRPGLNVAIARAAPDHVVAVGQEHLTFEQHSLPLRRVMEMEYPNLDAFVTVTEADARTYTARMPLPGVEVLSIPNSVPAPAFTADGHGSRTIVSAGRLAPSKRHDLLIQAFSMVAEEFPDWTLRIYGRGSMRGTLDRLVGSLGLEDRVWLMGPHPHVEEAWAQGEFAAVTSSEEPFGMTIVEAMRSGLPVVSTNCPHGPAAIIRHGEDGLLVPNKSVRGIAEGLALLMADEPLRQRMSEAALADSERYDPATVVRQHERLFADLAGARVPAVPPVPVPRPEPPPSCKVWASAEDGLAVLWFPHPPDRIVLAHGGERVGLVPDGRGEVPVDARRLDLAARTWEVLRVDGGRERAVADVEIHQEGYPLSAEAEVPAALVLPSRSTRGQLVLHVRRLERHAEVEHVEVADDLITVQGRILRHPGADPRARLLVRHKEVPRQVRGFSAPVTADGHFTAVVDPEDVVGDRPGDPEKWELRLGLSNGSEHPLGRHLTGVTGYKRIIGYPSLHVTSERGYGARLRPYYTVNDRLGLLSEPAAPILGVNEARAVLRGRRRERVRIDVRLDTKPPENMEYSVEVVWGSGTGRRFPLHEVPPVGLGGRLVGELPLLEYEDQGGRGTVRATWRLRLLMGPPGGLGRVGAVAVPQHTSRTWRRGPYVRSVTAGPWADGDLKVTVADVHMADAVRRRLA
ncbi:glycosyltransferase family 4 protein [Nocardiopsis sp. LOL_012]|uniref:glycosyltransferase family 4 protein n=1 Tax=Nocardiopsis sp. LOL_012 TaxID=3345409 RepID=UPI003A87F817